MLWSLSLSLSHFASTRYRWPRGGKQEGVCPVQYVGWWEELLELGVGGV